MRRLLARSEGAAGTRDEPRRRARALRAPKVVVAGATVIGSALLPTACASGVAPTASAQSTATAATTQTPSTVESPTSSPPSTASPAQTSEPSPTPSTPSPKPFLVEGRQHLDVDGDGQPDRVTLLAPNPYADCSGPCQEKLRVVTASGDTSSVSWPQVAESKLLPAADLDQDGDMEIVVGSGGGEASGLTIYDADSGKVSQVTTLTADGTARPLDDPVGAWRQWHSVISKGQLYDFRATTANPGSPPFGVKVLTWSMSGLTLTRSATAVAGCYTLKNYQAVITLGAC